MRNVYESPNKDRGTRVCDDDDDATLPFLPQ